MSNVCFFLNRTNVPVNCASNRFVNRKKFVKQNQPVLFLNISNIKMNVYEIAQKVNDRLNDGDESKFPTTLFVVAEFLYVTKPLIILDALHI